MPDKAPVCPWCGAKMTAQRESTEMMLGNDYFVCTKCEAQSPKIFTGNGDWSGKQAAAYAAAMKRFEPMQKPCDDCAGIVYRQTASGKIVPDGQCAVKFPPPCYRPDGDGCAYQRYIYGDYDDEPIDKCKECPLCYTDKVRHGRKPTDEERKAAKQDE